MEFQSRSPSHAGEFDYLFKIVLIGDSGVGKTNLLSRFTKNKFSQNYGPTVGVEFATNSVQVGSNTIRAQIWDTAGQERYKALTNAYYRNAVGALIVFDITRKETFINLKKWLGELQEQADENIVLLLIGNKSDLQDQRQVSLTEIQMFCGSWSIDYIETSALSAFNVEQAFHVLIERIYKNKLEGKFEDIYRLRPAVESQFSDEDHFEQPREKGAKLSLHRSRQSLSEVKTKCCA